MFDRSTFYASHQSDNINHALHQALTLLSEVAADHLGEQPRAVAIDHTVTPIDVGHGVCDFLVTVVGVYEAHL